MFSRRQKTIKLFFDNDNGQNNTPTLSRFRFFSSNHNEANYNDYRYYSQDPTTAINPINDINSNEVSNYIESGIWMRKIDDGLYLSEITIPGTHESGAARQEIPFSQCQSLSIYQQLMNGVRFLDIRCRVKQNIFKIYHGPISQKQTFDDVILACKSFLEYHSSEVILMKIKQEYSKIHPNEFCSIFQNYVNAYPNLFYLNDNQWPIKIGSVRGKIVLIANNKEEGLNGFDWGDARLFNKQGKWNISSIQEKWKLIEKQLQEAKKQSSYSPARNLVIYVNAMNASYPQGGKAPKYFSDELNKQMSEYLNNNSRSYYGIITMDFIRDDLVRTIIKCNLNQ